MFLYQLKSKIDKLRQKILSSSGLDLVLTHEEKNWIENIFWKKSQTRFQKWTQSPTSSWSRSTICTSTKTRRLDASFDANFKSMAVEKIVKILCWNLYPCTACNYRREHLFHKIFRSLSQPYISSKPCSLQSIYKGNLLKAQNFWKSLFRPIKKLLQFL